MKFSLKKRFSYFRKGMAEQPVSKLFTRGISPGLLEVARKGLSNGYELTTAQKTAYARRIANSHKGWTGMETLLKLIGKIYPKKIDTFD